MRPRTPGEMAEITCRLCGAERELVHPEELAASSIGRGGARMVQHLVREHGLEGRTAEWAVRDILGYTAPEHPCPRCGGRGELHKIVLFSHPVLADGRPIGLAMDQEVVWVACPECCGTGEARTA